MAWRNILSSFSMKASVLGTLMLGGCIATTFPYMRAETAQRLAAPAWMTKRDIAAAPYSLRAYERIHDRGGIAHLYIEGDGSGRLTSPKKWIDNPTPRNPVALHLASTDHADNVVYLARPCQYTARLDKAAPCDKSAWKNKRFSPEILESFNIALNNIKRRYDMQGFHIIGYAGGGTIAALLAAERDDILSLRTVAGVLDHHVQSHILGRAPLDGSLNPVDRAGDLSTVPQYHFIGGQDPFVPPAILHSYVQALPSTQCVQTMLVQEASHAEGWVSKWPELFALPVECAPVETPDFGETIAEDKPALEEVPFMMHVK